MQQGTEGTERFCIKQLLKPIDNVSWEMQLHNRMGHETHTSQFLFMLSYTIQRGVSMVKSTSFKLSYAACDVFNIYCACGITVMLILRLFAGLERIL